MTILNSTSPIVVRAFLAGQAINEDLAYDLVLQIEHDGVLVLRPAGNRLVRLDASATNPDAIRALAEFAAEGTQGHAASVPIAVPAAVGERLPLSQRSDDADGGAERTSVTGNDGGHGDDHIDPTEREGRHMAQQIRYAVLERSERACIESLDFSIFDDYHEALEHARWLSKHLTGSYAGAGDTVLTVVGIEASGVAVVDGLTDAERVNHTPAAAAAETSG